MKVLLYCDRTNQVENTNKLIMDTRMIGKQKKSASFVKFVFTGENSREKLSKLSENIAIFHKLSPCKSQFFSK